MTHNMFEMEICTLALIFKSDKMNRCWKGWIEFRTITEQFSSKRASFNNPPGVLLHALFLAFIFEML